MYHWNPLCYISWLSPELFKKIKIFSNKIFIGCSAVQVDETGSLGSQGSVSLLDLQEDLDIQGKGRNSVSLLDLHAGGLGYSRSRSRCSFSSRSPGGPGYLS